MQEIQVWFLGWENPLEEEVATHSSILAWESTWTEEAGGLESMGSQRVGLLLLLLSRFSRVRLCNPIDGSPPGSSVPGILQARTLDWVAISFSNALKWKVKSESEVAQSCPTLLDHMDCSLPGSYPWNFPGKNTGVGCHCLLQRVGHDLATKQQ